VVTNASRLSDSAPLTKSSRRTFLKAGILGAGAVSLSLLAFERFGRKRRQLPELMGALTPSADLTTGLPLLLLPPGFRYHTFSWAGSRLHDGQQVPKRADGMGVVSQTGSRITLVRNHEMTGSSGSMGAVQDSYDVTEAGTSTLVFDSASEQLIDSWVSLSGTLGNCAGGVTPWGTWLSCEEAVFSPALNHLAKPTRQLFWDLENAGREHGFVFEVPAEGVARAEPITAMGQFYHEAAAVDPQSGIVYMTEDISPRAGFYRYIPQQPGKLAQGGRLQMMRVGNGIELRSRMPLREELSVSWVYIAEPEQGFTPGNRSGDGVVTQGIEAGGTAFIALEGCAIHDDKVYFTSKSGGRADAGCVYEYEPRREIVRVLYESSGHDIVSGPDNIIMSPRGSLVVCEDRLTMDKAGQRILGLDAKGDLFPFCQVNPAVGGKYGGHDLRDTVLTSEWAGVTFSMDGSWMFCNVFNPGLTIAITGPWQDGLI